MNGEFEVIAEAIAKREGKKTNVDIAQIKEIMHIMFNELYQYHRTGLLTALVVEYGKDTTDEMS